MGKMMNRIWMGLAGISLLTTTSALAFDQSASDLDEVRALALSQVQKPQTGTQLGAAAASSASTTLLYVGGGLLAVGGVVGLAAAGGGGGGDSDPSPSSDGGDTGGGDTGGGDTGGGNTGPDEFGRESFPAQTQNASTFEDSEYNGTRYLGAIGASTAYARGADGNGVVVAIIDTRFDSDHPEYAGRVHAASREVLDSGIGLPDLSGDTTNHGTAVANIAIGGRNGNSRMGVAYGATILGLGVANSGASSQISDGSLITDAIIYAADNGADVINHSFLGAFSNESERANYGGPSNTWRDTYQRVITDGIMLVVAAGNEGRANPSTIMSHDPTHYAALAGHMIVAVGTDTGTGLISSESDRCGVTQNWCMAAPGWSVGVMPNDSGDREAAYIGSGTSFAAPVIAGAYALIKQTWPELTATEIQTLMFATAFDAGAAGVDAIYGHGILDLAAAFTPFGGLRAQSQSNQDFTPEPGSSMAASGPGVAVAQSLSAQSVISEDGFDRGYLIRMGALTQTSLLESTNLADTLTTQLDDISRQPHTAIVGLKQGLALAGYNDGISQSVSLIGDGLALHGGVARATHFGGRNFVESALPNATLADYALSDADAGFIRIDAGTTQFTAARGDDGRMLVRASASLQPQTQLSFTTMFETNSLLGLTGTGSFAIKGQGYATTARVQHGEQFGPLTLSLAAEAGRFGFNGADDSFIRGAQGSLAAGHVLLEAKGLTGGIALPLTPFNMDIDTALLTASYRYAAPTSLTPRFVAGWQGAFANDALKLGVTMDQSLSDSEDRNVLARLNLRF